MGRMTFVVEYEDGKEPPVGFTEDFMGSGGRLCSAAFFDYRDDLLTEAEVGAIQRMADEHEDDWLSWCSHFEASPDEIERKLNLMG